MLANLTRLIAALLAAACIAPAAARAEQPLVIGLAPFLSTHTLVELFEPLAQTLEAQLKRPVQLAAAPDLRRFAERCADNEYDLVIVPAHFARLLQQDAGFLPLAAAVGHVPVRILARRDGAVGQLSDLRGKKIAVYDRNSLPGLIGRELLGAAGLAEGRDYAFDFVTNHGSAVYAVRLGESDAAIVTANVLKLLPEDAGGELKVLAETPSLDIGGALLVHPRLGKAATEVVRAAILEYFERAPDGRKFIELTGMSRVRPLTAADLKPFDRYAAILRAQGFGRPAPRQEGGRQPARTKP